jgi:hypothetical protein
VYNFVNTISQEPITPRFEVNIFEFLEKYGITIAPWVFDFSDWQSVVTIIRMGFLVLFLVGLFSVTKRYIWTGGG